MDLDTQFHTEFDHGSEPDLDEGLFGSLMRRAIGEQIAEQRLIREALTDFDRRLEVLERTVVDRLVSVEREASDRIDRFERTVTERMLAFESVLKRIVDRLAGAEDHIVEAVDHGAQVTRTQLDALRPGIEGAVERIADAAEDREEAIAEAVAEAGRHLESTVHEAMDAELRAAIDEFRASLEAAERKIRRDVNRLTFAGRTGDAGEEIDVRTDEAGNGGVAMHADRVEEPENGDGEPRRRRLRRERPLRAR